MKTKMGFTWIDLMIVALVMALLSALVISAVMSFRKNSGHPRFIATSMAEQALNMYRAEEQRWPVTLTPEAGSIVVVFLEDNARVFAPLLKNPQKQYLDPSALLTKVFGKGVMSLRDAMKQGIAPESCPLGYLDPANRDIFKYFKVTFNLSLDTVNVEK